MGRVYLLKWALKWKLIQIFFLVCLHNLAKEIELFANVKFFLFIVNIDIVKWDFCLGFMLHLFFLPFENFSPLPRFWVDGFS